MTAVAGVAGVTAVAAAAAVLVGAGVGSAADRTGAPDACGATPTDLAASARVEPGPRSTVGTAVGAGTASGASAQRVAYSQASQLPVGLWSAASVTLRVPAGRGTVRLDLASKGFSTDSMEVQRWVPGTHRWVDLTSSGSDAAFPTHGRFSFTLTTPATPPAHATRGGAKRDAGPGAETVALRLQDLDRPGSLAVTASYDDGHGHSYRAAALRSPVTRPLTVFAGWPVHAALTRGGAPQPFTMTVTNTTDRTYPVLSALFYAYGMGGNQALTPRDLVLEQDRPGLGWTRLPLVASGCDPGMSAAVPLGGGARLAPGAGETVVLRLSVAATAPKAVTSADAGLAVQTGDTALASTDLPFAVRAQPLPPVLPVGGVSLPK